MTLKWWQATLVAIALVLVLIGIVWLMFRLWRRLINRRTHQKTVTTIQVPFFARLLQLLSRKGWHLAPSQTAAEFAQAIGPELSRGNGTAAVAHVPQQVVPEYYAVRFGEKS